MRSHTPTLLSCKVDFLFLCDIVINFRTGYMVDGQFVTDTRAIARYYVRTTFFVDLVGSFPINLILKAANPDDNETTSTARLNRQLRMLRVIKITRLLRLSKVRPGPCH